jgi:hypothetical protein
MTDRLKSADRWATEHFKAILSAFKTVESPTSATDFRLKLDRYLATGHDKLSKKLDEFEAESKARWSTLKVPETYKDEVLASYDGLANALSAAVDAYENRV